MKKSDVKLIRDLCKVFAPSGDESLMKAFVLDYVQSNQENWKVVPEVTHGVGFQDCILLKFGKPRTAIFAHMDSIGFTVRYQDQLVPIGGPDTKNGYDLIGHDSLGEIACTLKVDSENRLSYQFGRAIDRGTNLVFNQDFKETNDSIQSCYLDNRLGVFNALKVAETLNDGLIVFSTREEHGGGSVPFLARYMYEQLGVQQALISDITWVSDGVFPGEGVAISMRDSGLPRREFLEKVIELAEQSGTKYQLEVEGSAGSDAIELQASPYPIDWCFIGAAEENMHSPNEMVQKEDVESMIRMYEFLMKEL